MCCAGAVVVEVVLSESSCVEVCRQGDEVVAEQVAQDEVDLRSAGGQVLRLVLEVWNRKEGGRSLARHQCVTKLSDCVHRRWTRVHPVINADGEDDTFDLRRHRRPLDEVPGVSERRARVARYAPVRWREACEILAVRVSDQNDVFVVADLRKRP